MMPALRRSTLLTTLNAKPYSTWGSEDDALLSDVELVDNQQSVLNIELEEPAEKWLPVPYFPELANDPQLPNWFLDGSVTSLEIAGSATDNLGYPRVIRAGQMAVGATCRIGGVPNRKEFWRFVALNTAGYTVAEINPLRIDLKQAEVPHELLDWFPSNTKEQDSAFDLMSVRTLVRDQTRDEMLARERELVEVIAEPVYCDGRYVDHAPPNDGFLVVGVIKSHRAKYLSGRPLQVLYSLNEGERTPAFLIERRRGQDRTKAGNQVITFYIRLTSPNLVGPGGGLARIEVSERYFRNHVESVERLLNQENQKLLNAIAADLTQLRTRDLTYARGAVTVEPIRLIERELKLIFRDTQMAAMETMCLLN
jgi:hypothetical protein